MKLEIKHLNQYLPYKISFSTKDGFYQLVSIFSDGNLEFVGGFNPTYSNPKNFRLEEIKPLLKPLHSLLDECPEEIRDEFSQFQWRDFLDVVGLGLFDVYENIPTSAFMKLIEHHYDVFQLIPKGLALDINTFVTE